MVLSAVSTSLNLLDEWRSIKETKRENDNQVLDILRDDKEQEKQINRDKKERKGEALSEAGASGVKVSSFEDALFYHDLKAMQDIYDIRQKSFSNIMTIKDKQAASKRRKKLKMISPGINIASTLYNYKGG